MPAQTIYATLLESYFITTKIKHFVFQLEDNTFSFIPGQFITIFFDWQGRSLKRSYSIANSPSQDGRIEIAAGFVENGPGSHMLFNLKPGEKITLAGPYGRLILKPEAYKRLVLVASSTGLTPYRSMMNELRYRLNHNPSLNIIILLGVQNPQDVLYRDEFETFSNIYPQVKFRIQLSRPEDAILKPNEYHGYVQTAFPSLNLNPNEDIVYLCGNPSMIDACFTYLKEQGFNTAQIIREKYISN